MSKPIGHHADGTDCYTPNCSRAVDTTREAFERDFSGHRQVQPAATARLTDIASLADFEAERAAGFIRVQSHPTLPLDIYNYAEIAQFQRHWNPVTLASRGLIVDRDSGEIVARPFSKFFNHGEGQIDPALLTGPITVTDKLDGSLGITYPTPDGLALATRGSFQSEQAQHATAVYRQQYQGRWAPRAGRTYLYEIIYPENRIVVSYGELDDIVLLGAVDIKTGRSIAAERVTEWPGSRVEAFDHGSVEAVLAAPPRDNREGVVILYTDTDTRVKYKQEEYVRLHRIVTGVTPKRIWELMSSGQDIDGWLADLPDEFVTYVNENRALIQVERDTVDRETRAVYDQTMAALPADAARKDQAIAFQRSPIPKPRMGLMFNLLDGQQEAYDAKIWKLIEPAGIGPMRVADDA